MKATVIALPIALLLATSVSAQRGSTAPSVSSASQMVRAAGMPLQVGDLPPGMLTVRLVRGAFEGDIANHVVRIEVTGGRAEESRTDASGRAEFAHLPIGLQVRASATVDGEVLQSDVFPMPADGGVRVLLVSGARGDGPDRSSAAATSDPAEEVSRAAVAPAHAPDGPDTDTVVAGLVLGAATITLAFFFLRRS